MTSSDIIQLGILIATVAALLWSQCSDRKQRRLSMFAEYTKRYQNIILSMPNNVYMSTGELNALSLRHLQLYFNLCSEEYHLWRHGIVPNNIWKLWSEGMRITMHNPVYQKAWNKLRNDYYNTFQTYFDTEITCHSMVQD